MHGGGFAALRDRAGLMVNNYLTTSLRRQKLRRGSGCGSSLRARQQGRVTHKLPADGINKFSPIGCCTSPHLSLFSESVNAGVCVCARPRVWMQALRVCVCDLVLQPSSTGAGAVNRSVWPACRDKGVSISGPSSCQVRVQSTDARLGLFAEHFLNSVKWIFFFCVCLCFSLCVFCRLRCHDSKQNTQS